MSRPIKLLVCSLSGCLVAGACSAAQADAGANPYQVISERNVFGLKPPGPPALPAPPTVFMPPTELRLTGVVSMPGQKWACLMIAEPGRPARYFNLAEGQKDGEVEVMTVDVPGGTVKVRHHGAESLLTFEKPGQKKLTEIQLAEKRFVNDHTRAHEERERRERERQERERAYAAAGWDIATGQPIPRATQGGSAQLIPPAEPVVPSNSDPTLRLLDAGTPFNQ